MRSSTRLVAHRERVLDEAKRRARLSSAGTCRFYFDAGEEEVHGELFEFCSREHRLRCSIGLKGMVGP